jgi:hypothetical protein
MYSNVGLVEETKGGRKKERKIMNNNEVPNFVGTRHKETW